jgi:GPH family glycoside/pentoside/hexuronide:cation symporter
MPSLFGSSARKINKNYVIADADRVPARQKIGYGLGTFVDMWGHWLYPNIAYQVFGVFLGVAPTLIGIALIANRLFDGVSDPVFGWLSDRTRTRLGRRRPYMFVGAVLAGIGLPFLLAVTVGWGTGFTLFGREIPKYFWFMLLSTAIYLPMVGCFNMPYQSLGNELTPDFHERTSLFSVKNIVQKIPEAGLFFGGMFYTSRAWIGATHENWLERLKMLFTSFDAWKRAPDGVMPNMLLGAQVYLAICGAIMVVAGLVCATVVRERYYEKLVAATGRRRQSIFQMLGETFRCGPFRVQVLMQLAYQTGTSMINALGYTVTVYYVCRGNVSVGNEYNALMGLAYMVSGFFGVPFFAMLSRRIGKRQALMSGFMLACVVFMSTWWLYTPAVMWLQIFASGMISFCNAGFWTLSASIGADVIDCDELRHGTRREGAFSSCGSWVMKMGMAAGVGLSMFILDWIGFSYDAGGNQGEVTIFLLRFLLAGVPMIGAVIGLIALAKFPLTQERTLEIRAELEARRGKV